jgi:hypothetical protein
MSLRPRRSPQRKWRVDSDADANLEPGLFAAVSISQGPESYPPPPIYAGNRSLLHGLPREIYSGRKHELSSMELRQTDIRLKRSSAVSMTSS